MNIHTSDAPEHPLLTESDMLTRIQDLLAPAVNPAQLWVLVLDGLRRLIPLMMPIEDCPEIPEPALLDALAGVLDSVISEHLGGDGSVILVRERMGSDQITAHDRCWERGLSGAGARAHVSIAGIFLLTPHRLQPLRA